MDKELRAGIECALFKCMDVKKDERFLIVTDTAKSELAHAFAEIAIENGICCVIAEGPEQRGGEPPHLIAEAMLNADAVCMITSGSFSVTAARAAATKAGVRIASMPTITADNVRKTLSGDFSKLARRSDKLAEMLTQTSEVRVTTKKGMDFTCDISGREGLSDNGDLSGRGAFGNLPCGEACVAPVETKGDGTIIVDGVIFGVGEMSEKPLKLTMENGKITGVDGELRDKFLEFTGIYDDNATRIAEFGVGTNEGCVISNSVLIDEKIFGTIHIACGANKFIGGEQLSNIHYDMIINEPTVFFDGQCVIRDGVHIY